MLNRFYTNFIPTITKIKREKRELSLLFFRCPPFINIIMMTKIVNLNYLVGMINIKN